jgi:hypothetical protein
MADDVRNQHPIMLVRELSGMKMGDRFSIVLEADDEWAFDSHFFAHGSASDCVQLNLFFW